MPPQISPLWDTSNINAPGSDPYWIPDPRVTAAALEPVAELIAPETYFPDGASSATENGAAYPPLSPGFTAAQVQDMANACAVAIETNQPAPLAVPFTYTGALAFPGLAPGDSITHMVADSSGCVTNAELARQCAASPNLPQCVHAKKPIPRWYYAAGAVGAVALIWALMR